MIAVATVAPGASASPCSSTYQGVLRVTTGQAQPTNYTRTSPTLGSGTVPLAGAPSTVPPVTVTAQSVFTSNYAAAADVNPTPRNLQTGANGLALFQLRTGASTSTADGQTVTIRFDRPVSNLRFDLRGFTWPATNNYRDAGCFTTPPTSFTLNGQVSGVGTPGSPWVTSVAQINPAVSTANTVTNILFAGPTSSVTFHYYSASAPTSPEVNVSQAVYFSNMTFDASC